MSVNATPDILTLLRSQLGEMLECDPDTIRPDTDLRDELCIESLQQLELMHRLEERLEVGFDADAWLTPATVRQLADHIADCTAAAADG